MQLDLRPTYRTALGALFFALLCSASGLLAQSPKRGFPLGTDGQDSDAISSQKLANVNAVWYYNYGYTSPLHDDTNYPSPEFVPMVLYTDDLAKEPIPPQDQLPPHILGYNEPDHSTGSHGCQSDAWVFSPQSGAQMWPEVNKRVENNQSVGPASSYEGTGHPECYPWTGGSWFHDFHDDLTTLGIPHPHDIALHIYTCNIDTFKQYLEDAHANYPNNNFWVTEFACETEYAAETNSTHPSQAAVYSFIHDALVYMEAQAWVTRYSWHDPHLGTSKIFEDGSSDLTCTGREYADPYNDPSGYCATQ